VTHFNLEVSLVHYYLKFSSKIGIKQPKRMWINISFNVNLVTLGPMNKMLMISLIPPKKLIGKCFPLGESYGIRCGASFKRDGWKFLKGTLWMKLHFEIVPKCSLKNT
jgi:hypothetical protein